MAKTDTSSGFKPLDRKGLVLRVAGLLRKAIVTGQLEAGAHLSESVIARDLGISRAPVREAARLLESSGLLTSETNRGFFVRRISTKDLDDLYELRLVIEVAAVKRLVRNWTQDTEDALQSQVARLYQVAKEDHDMLAQVEADMQFHRLLCSGSDNPKFLSVFEHVATETEFSIMAVGQLYDNPTRIAETHEPIVEALASGVEDKAVAAISYHIGEARRVVIEQFRQFEQEREKK